MTKKQKKIVEASLEVQLPLNNEKIAKSVCNATAPENQETPKGVTAISKLQGSKIKFTVNANASFFDLISTTEDFFEKVALSLKTVETLE